MRKVTEPQSLEPSAFFQWYNCIFPYSKFLKISLFILYNLKISRTIISSFHLSIANSKLVHHSFCKRKVLWPCAVIGPIVVVSLEWKHMQRTSFCDKNKQEKKHDRASFCLQNYRKSWECGRGVFGEHNIVLSDGKFCLYSVAFLNFKLAER